MRRFGALKTLGERKAAFIEYLAQRKKEEAEEARQKRLKASVCIRAAGAGCAAGVAVGACGSARRGGHSGRRFWWQGRGRLSAASRKRARRE